MLWSVLSQAQCPPVTLFNESFDNIPGSTAGGAGTYNFPAGWTLVNVDNHVPAVAVGYVNDAWERREDFANNVTDSAMFSTSWYNPVNASDDWAWTPAIGPITANTVLNWNALTYDPLYPDGYEVRVMPVSSGPPTGSAGNLGNMVSNSTQVFNIAAENTSWTARSISLSSFAGQSVYIAFRNNSNDQFLLLIDDVNVTDNGNNTEVCNGLDDNCNGLTDEGLTLNTFYADTDGDSYGDPLVSSSSCNLTLPGYVSDNTDCNDANGNVYPGAIEVCNGIDDDCDGTTDLGNVLVAGPISGPSSQCVPVTTGSATFSTSSVPGASSYFWTVPAGMTILTGQGTTSIFVSWSPAAAHDGILDAITVAPVDNCGTGQASSLSLDINYAAPVRPSSISGPARLCPGDNGTYSVLDVARASSYQWVLPAGLTITGGAGTNIIQVSADNLFAGGSISCSAVNVCGASPVRTRSTGLNLPATPAAISGASSGLCEALGVSYSIPAVPNALSYTWNVPAGANIVNGQGSNAILVDFGSFANGTISVSASNSCGSGSSRSLAVKGAPAPAGPISGDVSICNGQSNVKYEVTTVAGATSYQWSIPAGATLISPQGFKEIFVNWGAISASGQQVSVITSNACGASSPRVLNGISIDPLNCIRLGDEGSAMPLSLYPNPASTDVLIGFESREKVAYTLQLLDLSGRIVYSFSGTTREGSNRHEINIENFASGVYFVQLKSEDQDHTLKLLVE
ncbi:MAG: T9SS type A sorting domain-containing protein [Bacteroidia bacterium]|nr:T9SS type A sorting domain-containing protein [Bacteroidia bacterium]